MKRGWCPGLHAPMESGDGLLVRVKPPGCRLGVGEARALAAAAGRWGNGALELTQRGNVQARGFSAAGAERFAEAMVAAGLGFTPEVEVRRMVMGPPLLGVDPGVAAGAEAVVEALERAFAGDARLGGLPGKFAVQVDAGGVLGGRAAAASLVVWTDGAAWGVRAGSRGDARGVAGPLPYPGCAFGGFALGAPFGAFDLAMLEGAADLAERWGTELRVTPWRALVLGRVPAGVAVDCEGWISDAGDVRLGVSACVGAPGCGRGSTAVRRDAAVFAAAFRGVGGLHVSGCAKGCAHPGGAAVTAVGRAGRYDLVRDGRAGDVPGVTGLRVDEVVAWLEG